MTDDTNVTPAAEPAPKAPEPDHKPKPQPRGGFRKFGLAGAAIALIAVGGGVGAAAVSQMRPSVQMAPTAPVAITKMADDSVVTVKGSVAEIFGDKFVLQDDSGRALIETGRAGRGGKLVKAGEQLSVQGRFDDGFIRAAFIVRADGKTETVGGFGPGWGPRHGPWGHHGPKGFGPMGPQGEGPAGPGPDGPKEEGRL